MSAHPLEDRLGTIRWRVRRVLCLHGLSWLAAVFFGLAFIAGWGDWLFHFDDRGVRMILLAGVLGAAGWIAYRYLVTPLRVPFGNLDLALRIEDRYPGLQDSLASTVDFLERGGHDPRVGSPALQQAVIKQTLERVRRLDFDSAIQTQPLRKAALVAACILFLVTITAWSHQADARLAARRLFWPWDAPAWPRQTNLRLLHANLTPLPEPQPAARGNAEAASLPSIKLAKGEQFEFLAENTTGTLPQRVVLEYRPLETPNARPTTEVLRPSSVRDKAGNVRELAAGMIPSHKGSLQFRVTGGDDNTQPWRTVQVIPPPLVEDLHVTLTPPKYMRRAIERLPAGVGHVQGYVGTHVAIVARINKPVQSAILRVKDQVIPATKLSDDKRQVESSFTITEAGTYSYRLELKDLEGFEGGEPPRYEIQGMQDAVPDVVIDVPNSDLQITTAAEVQVQVTAKDDLGLKGMRLVYHLTDPSAPVAEEPAAGAASLLSIPLFKGEGRPLQQTEKHVWKMADLKLSPGMRVVFHAEAGDDYDLGPEHVGRSISRTLIVVSAQEKARELAQRQVNLLEELQRTTKLQQEARQQIGELQLQMQKVGRLQPSDMDTMQRAELAQRQVAAQLTNPGDGLENAAQEILNDLNANDLKNEAELRRRAERIAGELRRLGAGPLPVVEQELTQARKLAEAAARGELIPTPSQSPKKPAERSAEKSAPSKGSPTDGKSSSEKSSNQKSDAGKSASEKSAGKNPDGGSWTNDAKAGPPQPDSGNKGDASKGNDKKSPEGKSASSKSSDPKSGSTKSNDSKSADSKNSDRKSSGNQAPSNDQEPGKAPDGPSASGNSPGEQSPSKTGTSSPQKSSDGKSGPEKSGSAKAGADKSNSEKPAPDKPSLQNREGQSESPQQALDRAAENQREVAETLNELTQELAQWRTERDTADDVADLLDNQRQLNKQTGELSQRTLTKPREELTPQDQADLAKAAERQRRQGEKLEQLEGKMQQQADQLETRNPTAASTLRNAVEESRQAATSGRMRDASEQIRENRLGSATQAQQDILRKLSEMQESLENRRTGDTETLVKSMKRAEQDLETLRGKQRELQAQTRQAQQNPDPAARKKELERLGKQQAQLREQAKQLARQLQRLQLHKAGESAKRASQRMEQAQQELDQGQEPQGAKDQQEVLDDLEQAQRELAKARREAEEQLAQEQLEKIAPQLQALSDRQQALLDETKRLEGLRSPEGTLKRSQLSSLSSLRDNQQNLRQETQRLAEKLSAAEAFALALKGAARQMLRAAELLEKRLTNEPTQRAETAAKQRFLDLIAALNPDQKSGAGKPKQQGGGGEGGSQQSNAQGEGISGLAQLKMLKTLQQELLERTTELAGKRSEQQGTLTPEQQQELEEIGREQGMVADLARNLMQQALEHAKEDPDEEGDAAPADKTGPASKRSVIKPNIDQPLEEKSAKKKVPAGSQP